MGTRHGSLRRMGGFLSISSVQLDLGQNSAVDRFVPHIYKKKLNWSGCKLGLARFPWNGSGFLQRQDKTVSRPIEVVALEGS